MKNISLFCIAIVCLINSYSSGDGVAVKLASLPALSPDGSTLVFEHRQDLWSVPTRGGQARRLTYHPAFDTRPVFSPDGSRLVFASNRDDSWQVYAMPAEGGAARQVTFHSEGSTPLGWYSDGDCLLVRGTRDYRGHMQTRFFKVAVGQRRPEQLLFDAYGVDADISADGSRLLFTRFGEQLYRKGYRGSAAGQIWLYDIASEAFSRVAGDPSGCRSPLWKPDGTGFYYLCQRDGCFNVWEQDLASGDERQLTHFTDASVIIPALSRDGGTMVFRQLFDFYRMDPGDPDSLEKIEITVSSDDNPPDVRRRWYKKAWNNDSYGTVDFTDDALEICFTAGGDLWVMDTVLREPKLVCGGSAIHEREAVFGPEGKSIYFLRDDGIGVNIWKATPADSSSYWWQNDEFELTQLTDDRLYRFNLGLSPKGDRLSVVQHAYELWSYDLDCDDGRKVYHSPYEIYYDWSPDGNWFAASTRDSWGISDVWILSEKNIRAPYNLSRHPNWDSNARWSPDGKTIAFTGKRFDDETDIFYAYLRKEDDRRSERDKRLGDAIESMQSKRNPEQKQAEEKRADDLPAPPREDDPDESAVAGNSDAPDRNAEPDAEAELAVGDNGDRGTDGSDQLEIDFEGLADRTRRIDLSGGTPSHLFWSFDSKALAFRATIGDRRGTYKVVFTGSSKPEFMTKTIGEQARWIRDGSRILWLSEGLPAIYKQKLPFEVYQETNISDYKRLAFRIAWRNLRDDFYDPALNNLDWEQIRLKYEDAAADSASWAAFDRVLNMLFGELNASHMGFDRSGADGKEWRSEYSSGQWNTRTAHLGLIFDPEWRGEGLRIKHVIPDGPCDKGENAVAVGDIVNRIDGVHVDSEYDLTQVLNGRYERVVNLLIERDDGDLLNLQIEPESYENIRNLLRGEWIESMREKVEKLSAGKLGYLNIEKMNKTSLRRFEREVYARGFGKDGLVIDVRNNGGGFTADQLLAILCHPEHAFTIARGGSRSYQQGYLNTAIWTKPIIVICNQYSASNAEIFSHAVKTMGRGNIVGVPTRGAVISTPTERILDIGNMKVPNRGWFLPDGRDMEIAPCEPDHYVEARPGDIPAGRDPQLEKAVEVLLADIRDVGDDAEPVYASDCRTGPDEDQK